MRLVDAAPLTLDTDLAGCFEATDGAAVLMRINDALLALEGLDSELARVVEMRMSVIHLSEVLGRGGPEFDP